MKIIFTDIDGVLNSRDWMERRGPLEVERRPDFVEIEGGWTSSWEEERARDLHQLDPVAVERLDRIVRATGAVCVLSSTWRINTPLGTVTDLLRYKANFSGSYVGSTPKYLGKRGNEIQAWLDMLGPTRQPDRFIILDDDSDMAHLMPYLLKTSHEVGLTDADVERAIAWLNDDKTSCCVMESRSMNGGCDRCGSPCI